MSRANEIQQKLNLQAELQKMFNGNARKVMGWLDKNEPDKQPDVTELNSSKESFFTLPVVQAGSGLNFAAATTNLDHKEDIHTVGEFIRSDKKVSSLSKKRRHQPDIRANTVHRISNDDTRAMIALKRKMRQTQRDSIRHDVRLEKTAPDARTANSNEDDSEDEEERAVQKTTKKTVGLLFNGKKKRK